MGYMIVVRSKQMEDPSALVAYTGVEHETKQDALSEYLEAAGDPEVIGAPYVVLV